jgi:hypothetical protein
VLAALTALFVFRGIGIDQGGMRCTRCGCTDDARDLMVHAAREFTASSIN